MTRFTSRDLAKANNISREAASALIQYLRQAALVTNVGSVAKVEGQKGRSEALYEGDAVKISAHLSALKVT